MSIGCPLVNAGTANWGGSIKYAFGNFAYGDNIPTRVAAGEYKTRFKAVRSNGGDFSYSNVEEIEEYVYTTIAQAPCQFYPENIRWVTQLTYNGQNQDFLEDGYTPGEEVVPSRYGTWDDDVYLSWDQENWYRAGYEGKDMLYASERDTYYIYYKLVPVDKSYTESEVYCVDITIS